MRYYDTIEQMTPDSIVESEDTRKEELSGCGTPAVLQKENLPPVVFQSTGGLPICDLMFKVQGYGRVAEESVWTAWDLWSLLRGVLEI